MVPFWYKSSFPFLRTKKNLAMTLTNCINVVLLIRKDRKSLYFYLKTLHLCPYNSCNNRKEILKQVRSFKFVMQSKFMEDLSTGQHKTRVLFLFCKGNKVTEYRQVLLLHSSDLSLNIFLMRH